MHSQALLPSRRLIKGPPPHRSARAARAAAQGHHITASESAEHRQLRQQLGSVFPNALLLEDSRLPDLHSCRHFVNLTNGLDLGPILHQLQLPFSVVRIRSTSLEQQAFESLLLELDANLLLPLALGHSCVVWDTGCRNRKTGAPRALWYGLEFIRFALNRCWSKPHSSGSSGSSSSSSSSDGGSRSHLLRAHIRGHDVSRDFEAACRSLAPSTKTRLRYYQRYVSPSVRAEGVRLAGLFRRTDRDEDVEHFVALAQQYCGPADVADSSSPKGNSSSSTSTSSSTSSTSSTSSSSTSSSSSSSSSSIGGAGHKGVGGEGGTAPADWDVAAYRQLAQEGIGMFTRGLSHTQFRELGLSQQQ